MVRRSTLVYDLLKSEGIETDGFSAKEILDRLSETHNIAPGKGLKKQINVALRRGIDFGILTKENNKYKFDSDFPTPSIENVEKIKKRGHKKKKKKSGKTRKMKSKSRSRRGSVRKTSHEPPPRPRVVPPPNWTQKKRNLREEPIPKFIRHSDHPPIPL